MSVQNTFGLPNEVFVTLFASATVALITAYQIIALMRGKDSAAASSESTPAPAVLAQLAYGLLVFVGFAWWTINLSTIGLFNWALVSVCFALVGLVMPVIVWQQATKNTSSASADDVVTTPVGEPSLFVEDEDGGLATAMASLAALSDNVDETSEATANSPALASTESAPLSVTQVATPSAPTSVAELDLPTDSILKRHYQQLLATQNAQPEPTPAVVQLPGPAVLSPVLAPLTANIDKAASLPEDSVLKRHTLGIIRAQIAAKLPDCPSDSVLKRHYSQLLASELAKHPLL